MIKWQEVLVVFFWIVRLCQVTRACRILGVSCCGVYGVLEVVICSQVPERLLGIQSKGH